MPVKYFTEQDVEKLRQQVTELSAENIRLNIMLETMSEHADAFQSQLVEIQDHLEENVNQRTQELAEKNRLLEEEIKQRKYIEEQLRESEEYSRTLLKESLIGLSLVSIDGKLIELNSAFANIIGYSIEEALKLNFWALTPEKYTSLEQQQFDNLQKTGRFGPYEKEYIHKNGHHVHVMVSGLLIEHKGEHFIWINVADISSQKQAEFALMRAKDAAEQARIIAEMANRAKSTFLANMSHELRTPLNAIIGYSELLEEEIIELEQKEFLDDLQKIHTAGKHLLSIISDILDLSKIEAGRMQLHFETFDLISLLNEVATMVQPLMSEKNNILEIRVPKTDKLMKVHTDRTKLRQMLLNLLSNATKFTERGIISFTIEHDEKNEQEEWLKFHISDNGIGMSEEVQKTLFQPFMQADSSSTRRFQGTGLGLAITYNFTRMLGGKISVNSQLGKGSTFILQLPIYTRTSKKMTSN